MDRIAVLVDRNCPQQNFLPRANPGILAEINLNPVDLASRSAFVGGGFGSWRWAAGGRSGIPSPCGVTTPNRLFTLPHVCSAKFEIPVKLPDHLPRNELATTGCTEAPSRVMINTTADTRRTIWRDRIALLIPVDVRQVERNARK